MSGAWAGSPITVQEVISGNNLGKFYLPSFIFDKLFRNVSRTLESVVWLFPYPSVFNDIIVYTPTKNYSASDYVKLFNDIRYPVGYSMYKGVENIREIPDPKVPTHCYWGLGTKTPLSYRYDKEFPVDPGHDPSNTTYSDGDGAVNKMASEACLKWSSTTLVQNKTFEGVAHVNMVKNDAVLEEIAKVVTNVVPKSMSHPKPSDGMFRITKNHGLTTYNAVRRMIRKMVQMMVRI